MTLFTEGFVRGSERTVPGLRSAGPVTDAIWHPPTIFEKEILQILGRVRTCGSAGTASPYLTFGGLFR